MNRAWLLVAWFGVGCSNTLLGDKPSVAEVAEVETCKVAKDPLNPFVVEWRGAELTNFEAASNRGVVVVSYAGCNLKVLTRCRTEGKYEFEPTTANRDSIFMDTREKLYANLPLGAAGLRGELEAGRGLNLDYVALGVRVTDQSPTQLTGDCEGANFYVRSMTVGAFELSARAAGSIGGGVTAPGGAGIGADHSESSGFRKQSGDVAVCISDPTANGCRSLIQLSLERIAGAPPSSGGKTAANGQLQPQRIALDAWCGHPQDQARVRSRALIGQSAPVDDNSYRCWDTKSECREHHSTCYHLDRPTCADWPGQAVSCWDNFEVCKSEVPKGTRCGDRPRKTDLDD